MNNIKHGGEPHKDFIVNNNKMKFEVFEMNGIFYKFQQDKYEPREIYIDRIWFILNEIKNNKSKYKNFNELLTKSRIESNKKNLKCNYN